MERSYTVSEIEDMARRMSDDLGGIPYDNLSPSAQERMRWLVRWEIDKATAMPTMTPADLSSHP